MTTNTTEEISTTYSPAEVEAKWYKKWEAGNYFKPKKGKQNKSYCIIVPPPNVTGRLHAGHALDITTQDSLIRFKRMKGYETLFVPGLDHAESQLNQLLKKWFLNRKRKLAVIFHVKTSLRKSGRGKKNTAT